MNHQFVLAGGANLCLRPVAKADDEFLLSVYASTRADELAQVPWSDEQKTQFVKWQFDLQRREYDRGYPAAQYDVILLNNHPVGRIWIGRDHQEIRLLDIAILPEFQKRGIGTVLLQWLIDEAKSVSKTLRHTVFVMNRDAQRFYKRLGFVEIEDLGAYKHMEYRPSISNEQLSDEL